MASDCISGGSDWRLGKISPQKEWSGVGPGCPGQWWSSHPWRGSNTVWMWHLGTWLSSHGGVGLAVGLGDLRGLSQPSPCCDSVLTWGLFIPFFEHTHPVFSLAHAWSVLHGNISLPVPRSRSLPRPSPPSTEGISPLSPSPALQPPSPSHPCGWFQDVLHHPPATGELPSPELPAASWKVAGIFSLPAVLAFRRGSGGASPARRDLLQVQSGLVVTRDSSLSPHLTPGQGTCSLLSKASLPRSSLVCRT